MSIASVVVTYNRKELLKRVVQSLRNQTVSLDAMIVVDNHCTDGSGEWLDSQKDLIVIHQENVGGSGGFYTGIQYAHKQGYDWIWCMDDDVFPQANCLEELLKKDAKDVGILCPQRLQNGKIYIDEYVKLNLSNIFKGIHLKKLTKEMVAAGKPVSIESMVFEGPLIKKAVVDKIGYPNKDLFIYFDDTDYSYRAVLANWKVLYIPTAKMEKYLFDINPSKKEIFKRIKWKQKYLYRNYAYFGRKYGRNVLFKYFDSFGLNARLFVSITLNLVLFTGKYNISDYRILFRSYIHGVTLKLGKYN